MFFVKRNPLVIEAFARKIWNLLESSIFHALSHRTCSAARLRFRESGAAVADDVYPAAGTSLCTEGRRRLYTGYPGTKHSGATISSLYFLEKMENKTNPSNIFWD